MTGSDQAIFSDMISKAIGIQKLISNNKLCGLTYKRHLLAMILAYHHSFDVLKRKSLRYDHWMEGMCSDEVSPHVHS